MLYPPVADLLKNVDSRYLLVNVVAHRARQIAAEAQHVDDELDREGHGFTCRDRGRGGRWRR